MTAQRRPLKSRSSGWAQALASRLVASRVTPNQISAGSIGFAGLGFLLFWGAGESAGVLRALALLLAAACCQLRLLCNLLDGMVAVEGGKGSATGPFWNEGPDRVADILLLVGAGLAAGAPALGWAAAAMAVLTAYLRELGRAEGLAADFSGPQAKPHRVALLTGAAVVGAVIAPALLWGLWLIVLGTALTALRRAVHLLRGLQRR